MEATVDYESNKKSSLMPMIVAASSFFLLGFIAWINGSLMPYLKQMLELTPLKTSLIIFTFYISVTFSAIPSAKIIKKIGYKNSMALGMVIMMIAALLYIPAAKTHLFEVFLAAQIIYGIGFTLLQTAVNPYVVKFGPEESAAVRVSIMGILNKFAGVIAPHIFTALIVVNLDFSVGSTLTMEQKDMMAQSLVMPYVYMALLILAFTLFVKFSSLPELQLEQNEGTPGVSEIKEALKHPSLALGVVALFFYVAVEVIAGDTIGIYALSLKVENYSIMTSYTMFCMVIGYIIGIALIPRFISQQTALTGSAVIGILLSLAVVFGNAESYVLSNALLVPFGLIALPDTLMFIAALGLANAMVWPAVWPLALSGLGRLTSVGSGLLIMGIAGGAFGPLMWGGVSSTALGQQGAYLVMIPCYLFILFYALKGHKMKSW
ncbi:N-acetylglucosamine MFS transporter NagP [Pseudoalteromonas fenneropenaei]|uniref:N-acetylglucosamine MFS transporter NagP n=1 Tax=Pseudoalteromonas fenneropenaei TaxID=1737459 RepID=A0ABV7CKC2_9GAMM